MQVDGMCCASEVPIIHRILDALPGVDTVSVDVLGKTATIVHVARLSSPGVLMDALNKGKSQ